MQGTPIPHTQISHFQSKSQLLTALFQHSTGFRQLLFCLTQHMIIKNQQQNSHAQENQQKTIIHPPCKQELFEFI
ncbi:MAG: hypothetical protein D3908_05235, partial [Candidatus Electrothrix sp. AUS4]|nr:hypothetical protein [Candidatus Electrothrix sp. AUS4]